MPKYRLLHCADLHLDSPLWGLEADPDAPAERIRGATRAAFSAMVDYGIEQQVAAVVIAGDLYDGDWQDYRTGQFLVRELGRLTAAGIRVVAISGNHDAESVITRKITWPEGAHMLSAARAETVSFPELELSIHGRSFAKREVLENLLPSYPAPVEGHLNVGLLHTSATGRFGHAPYAPCTVEQLAAHGYEYWALGHVHTREILGENPWIVFPGNLQGRHIREPGAKGATLIAVDDSKITSVEHVSFDVVRWAEITADLAGTETEEDALARIRTATNAALALVEGRLLAARLRVTGATQAHAALMRDPAGTREKIRAELQAVTLAGTLWVEQITLATTPAALAAQADAPLDEMTAYLLRDIEQIGPETLLAAIQPYAQAMLDRAGELRARLGEDDPAVQAAAGNITPELLQQARALLLAALDT